ncbi:Phytanoyl-CoA dioxygenase (PhyH) [Acinetobacter marinus]|uniref:Phytanoyl-CoA dioxygenase (PhyH) n=1 Tax=Acinetobacter marinus TaxID=281375 RepID=A0A1G6NKA8_9GAMM|nr:phytanoyl-CoA dioxygenase family protein [Acinetobacter marinus]SDC68313.1 Phytanoyl-CoA dioxygenase (PhyH) [Acinetobacter marinus]
MKKKFKQIQQFWQKPQTKQAWQELKQIAKSDPVKFPWWLATTFSTASSFVDHPILGNSHLNDMGLHELRVKQGFQLANARREKLAQFLSRDEVAQYQQNGFILKENFLPEAEFQTLKTELTETPLPTRETLQGDTVTRRMALDFRTLPDLPNTQKLIDSRHWQNLINYVGSFKLQPLYYVQVIISQVRKSRPDPQTALHSDTFHPSMKAWLFFTDVAEDEGPFVYVAGSHILNDRRLAWERERALNIQDSDRMSQRGSFRIKESELADLGYGAPKKFAVKANTLVIADTYGFHARGLSARPSMRIELWAFARRNPFLPWAGFDPTRLPLVKSRLIPALWWGMDMMEEKGIRKNPWRDVGLKRATDPAEITSK